MPSWSPSIFTLGQCARKYFASAHEFICEQYVRPSQRNGERSESEGSDCDSSGSGCGAETPGGCGGACSGCGAERSAGCGGACVQYLEQLLQAAAKTTT